LCPVQTHCRCQQLRRIAVHPVEVPHPAQVARRKALGCGIGGLQVFRRRDSRAFLRSAADQPTNFTVQLHLRELRRHKRVQCGKHGGVICGLADIHGLLLSGVLRLINAQSREKHGDTAVFFSALTCFR